MNNAAFIELARRNTLEMFYAYCHENDMEKTLSFFSKESCFIGWGAKEVYLNYQSISATARERMSLPYYLELSNMQTEVINATESYCVVLFTANVNYHTDGANAYEELERATLVFHKEQGEAKIVYLHSSAANKIHTLGKILPLEHGVEATRLLTKLEYERSMAVDMCDYSPNGLLYCLIGDHYPLIYANQTMCNILGCKDFAELMEYTKGEMECTIYREDLPLVRQALLSHVNGVPYTINYRLVNKQGQYRWITERGRYLVDADTGEEYYICTVIPLELDQEEFTYGNLVDYSYINNAKISVELFLQQTLEYNDFNNRSAVCQKLLQHCCETLQASGGVVTAIKEHSQNLEPIYYYDVNNEPASNVFDFFTWAKLEEFFTEDGFSICSDLHTVPESTIPEIDWHYLRSTMTKIITIEGEPRYLVTAFCRHKMHHWTENEQEILEQTAKLYSLLLNENF